MRAVVTVGSATQSAWIPTDIYNSPFSLLFGVTLDTSGNLTYSVQHSVDNPNRRQRISISRSTTTATVTLVDHGLSTSDSVIIDGTGNSNLDGTYTPASITDKDTFTYTVSNTGATSGRGYCAVMRVFSHPVVAAKTTGQNDNYAFPIGAIRLNVTSYTAGKATMVVTQSIGP